MHCTGYTGSDFAAAAAGGLLDEGWHRCMKLRFAEYSMSTKQDSEPLLCQWRQSHKVSHHTAGDGPEHELVLCVCTVDSVDAFKRAPQTLDGQLCHHEAHEAGRP